MNEENNGVLPEIRPWSAKRKPAVVLDIWKGKTVTMVCQEFDLTSSEVEAWIDEAQGGMENALRAVPTRT